MFKIKRPAIIGILVLLLVFTGYLNHQLTEQAQKKSSKDYQNHELAEKEKYKSEDKVVKVAKVKSKSDDLEKVDTPVSNDESDSVEGIGLDSNEIVMVNSIDEKTNETLETMYQQSSTNSKNYFVEYRLSRDKLRASLIDRLDEIVNNANTNEKVREEAQKEVMSIGNVSQKELQIEGLIKGKGYEDALVFLTDEDIKVVVSTQELKEQDMVKILEIVHSETDYDTNNIKIMKKQ